MQSTITFSTIETIGPRP